MLLGNKIDLVEEEEGRVVTTKAGAYLADVREYIDISSIHLALDSLVC